MSIGQHERIPYVTSRSFDRIVIESPVPVLVNFQTPWSRRMVPLLGRLAQTFRGQLRVVQADISADAELAARFKIRAVPTLLIFKKGIPVEFIVGTVPPRFLLKTVSTCLGAFPGVSKARHLRNSRQWPSLWTLAFDSTPG